MVCAWMVRRNLLRRRGFKVNARDSCEWLTVEEIEHEGEEIEENEGNTKKGFRERREKKFTPPV